MKTKFILHGGMLSYENPHNDAFFKEFTKDLMDGDKVLHVGFARKDNGDRQRVFERDGRLIKAQTDKKIILESAKLETLIEQAVNARAIFVTGGDTDSLQADMAKRPEFLETTSGKVYAGSSAGALITSTFKYACAADEVQEGLGWLPIRLMVHYGNPEYNSTDKTLKELEKYPKELKLVVLPECEWQVIEADV